MKSISKYADYEDYLLKTGNDRTSDNYDNYKDYEKSLSKKTKKTRRVLNKGGEVKPQSRGPFMKLYYDVLDDGIWLRNNRNKTTLYFLLVRYICRRKMYGDTYNIYNNYFMKNKLACCVSEKYLAEIFGYKSRYQIHKMLFDLENDGAFVVDRLPQQNPMKAKKVFILGEFAGGEERLYGMSAPDTNP